MNRLDLDFVECRSARLTRVAGMSDLGRNESADHDEFGFGEQSGEFANPTDVPLPVSRLDTVGCTQTMLRVVAVQHVDLIAITK